MSDVASTLENIKGIGPATRTAVLDAFPTLDALAEASLEDLEAVKGVGPATAKAIRAEVAKARKETAEDRAESAVDEVVEEADEASDEVVDAVEDAVEEIVEASGDVAEGTLVELREQLEHTRELLGDQAGDASAQVKAALTSIQKIVAAAIEAGKDEYPQAERQVKAAMTSIRKVGPALVEALRDLRGEGADEDG